MQYVLLLATILFFTSCSNGDTNADGSSMNLLHAARRDLFSQYQVFRVP
ncbi:MAG: hypothetical protein H0V91_15605 [Flavisolibacter sp.]|nr:hypothetical protein [Flavisolibacter sp.]